MFADSSEFILEKALLDFKNFSSYSIKIGCELEFFLIAGLEFKDDLAKELKSKFPLIYEVDEDQGEDQFEIKTKAHDDLIYIYKTLSEIKDFVAKYANDRKLEYSFQGKPKKDDCGSALQFNISLHDDDTNLFSDVNNQNYQNLATIIISYIPQLLFISAPTKADYYRLDFENNIKLHNKGKYIAPINYSIGNNNRTCLIRCLKNRLEYRLPSANCDIALNLLSLIFCIKESLTNNNQKQLNKIYGNSFDAQYKCQKLENYEEAKKNFEEGQLNKYIKLTFATQT